MERTAGQVSESTSFDMAGLMLHRLPLCLGVTAGFCLILAYAWQQVFSTWQMIAWSAYAVSVFIIGWWLIRRLSESLNAVGMTIKLVEDINNLTVVLAIATGLIWIWASGLQFYHRGSDQWLYLSILIGAAASSGMLFSYNIKAALIKVGMVLLPCTIQVYLADQNASAYFVAFTLIYLATLYLVLIQFHRLLEKNVSLRIESEQAAKKQSEVSYLFEQHWLNAPLAAIQWDRDNCVIDWNPNAECLFGYSKSEALGKHADYFVADSSRDQSKQMWSALFQRKKEGNHSVHEVKHKEGDILTSEWYNTPLLKDGRLIGAASFVEDITSKMEAKDTIQRQATYDNLTSLPNRRRMMDELERAISRSQRTKQYAAVLFLDLDHFKDINDTQGHHVGDLVLQFFAKTLRKAVRNQDVVARFGGDEFVVLIEDLGKKEADARTKVLAIADKIMEMGKEVGKHEGLEYEVELSGGIVIFNNDRYSSHDILKQADLAMYRVKDGGRKGFSFYDESMTVEAEYRVTLIHELRQGVENKEFDLHFQPILDPSGKMIFAESLLRWRRPSQRIVPAGEFIDFMSTLPMMNEVGLWVFETVCENIINWCEKGQWTDDMSIFVNISPKQFHNDKFSEDIKKIIEKHGVNPHQLVFEITEESLIHDLDKVRAQLMDLIDYGIRVALDDFGTGYSSLAMLQKLPVQFVKLDREFISNLDVDEDGESHSIVRAVIKLCEIMSLKVIAEGVETEKQYHALKDMGCDYFQGYYFHKPMAALEFTKLINPERGDNSLKLVASRTLTD
ncbi:MAG: EAL domain-containing protein [Porticoccus sp.]|nr:EAL domain-containing protein [Porticoccus sp.]